MLSEKTRLAMAEPDKPPSITTWLLRILFGLNLVSLISLIFIFVMGPLILIDGLKGSGDFFNFYGGWLDYLLMIYPISTLAALALGLIGARSRRERMATVLAGTLSLPLIVFTWNWMMT